MRKADRSGSEAGFTLVETLVALAVVGFLIVLTSTILHSASSTLAKVSGVDAEADARSSDLSFLRRLLAHGQPDFGTADRKGVARFDGLPTRARFLAPSEGRKGVFDVVRYDLHDDDRGRLHVTWRLDRPANQEALSADDVLPEIRIVGFSYFGLDRTSGASSWVDRWQGRDDLPRAIRLNVEIHGRPSEIVASLALADSAERE